MNRNILVGVATGSTHLFPLKLLQTKPPLPPKIHDITASEVAAQPAHQKTHFRP